LYDFAEYLKNRLKKTQKNIQFIDSTGLSLPGLIFSIKNIDMEELSRKLKEKNWYLPVYSLPNSGIMPQVARVVIRYGYDLELIDTLVSDIALIIKSIQLETKFTILA
jgi:glutamate/tyrosine decarboxylase-like PLP-dependent enzyme